MSKARPPRGRRGAVLRRRLPTRPEKTKVLIVTSGRQTEPNYFRALRNESFVRNAFAVTVKKGRSGSPTDAIEIALQLKQEAESRCESYDSVFCVIDVEGPENRVSLNEAIALGRGTVDLCFSNPCFEVWFLSHFVRSSRSFINCNSVISELNKHWEKNYGQIYSKNDDTSYLRLRSYLTNAIENAKQVREVDHAGEKHTTDCNSSTDVYKLVSRLLSTS